MVTKEQLTSILKNPESLTLENSMVLSQTIEKYPFFQAVKAIELKALKIQNSHLYNQKLKITAAHTVDRGVLFDFITSKSFHKNTAIVTKEKTIAESLETENNTEEQKLSSESIKMTEEEANKIVDPMLFEAKNAVFSVSEKEKQKESEQEIISKAESFESAEELNINAPLNFNKNEKHSFSEWLKLTSIQPINRDIDEVESVKITPKPKLIESPLIDSFLKNNPKITPVKPNTPTIDLTTQNTEVSESLMTETLAKVYLAQSNYKKAIQAYKILSLKNPQKSGLFADQIRAIEKLQESKE